MENKMMKGIKRFTAALTVVGVLATGYSLVENNAYAAKKAEIPTPEFMQLPRVEDYQPEYMDEEMYGKFIEEPIELLGEDGVKSYYRYVVQPGDNPSLISEKICKFYGVEPRQRYWTILPYLNNLNNTMFAGQALIFPDTFEDVVALKEELRLNVCC